MSVGGVGGVGGGGAAGSAGGVGGVGGAGAVGGAPSVGSTESIGGGGPAESAVSSSESDTKAAESAGMPMQGPQMSTQDFCALRTQAAQPVQESPEVDLHKMLEWLMAIKLLEAMNKEG